ncbi:tetratricopeptide repeat protein [Myroides pelagicus]|uniref:Tetratricopeptide repeat protein n=1 Tax=Myroides pelagicus TaxID=270914 RepID=A0A7K1GJE0_9FLAO|nr:tetratricopeptide repeat protein [Myroides pelagicus]
MINSARYFLMILFGVVFLYSCSVKKDRLVNRGYHAMTTKYNILYNGDLAYEEALFSLKENYRDNFWEILPVERIEIKVDPEKQFQVSAPIQSKQGSILDNFSIDGNVSQDSLDGGIGFTRAENKATKAIQKHSMYIQGRERNWQMDEAYIMLGKARYHDGRFVPALEAFNYILYKYPDSDKIDEAKVWREKANLRLSYDDIAIKNLKEFLAMRKGKMRKQTEADANAILAQGYINIEQYDEAIAPMKRALEMTTTNEERARYLFILGQLYAKTGKTAEAFHSFENIVKMKRKGPRSYYIHSYSQLAELGMRKVSDSTAFLKTYKKLMRNRENRGFLDVLNRQVGLFYNDVGKTDKALEYLKQAVKFGKTDEQLKAYNYLSIADIYFNSAGYAEAGSYYDSALSILPEKFRERYRLSKRRDALKEVVKYERIAHVNDSILNLVEMSDSQRLVFFQKHVEELRKEDFRKLQANLKEKNRNSNVDYFNMASFGDAVSSYMDSNEAQMQGGAKSTFYFYSTQASGYGKQEFKRKWGNRPLVDNWKWASAQTSNELSAGKNNETNTQGINTSAIVSDARYDVTIYLSKIPVDSLTIGKLRVDRDFAYFQLGSMYSEKFKKYDLSIYRFETLLAFEPKPMKRLILPSMYKLYKVYLEVNPAKAIELKALIISRYPDSRYAKLLQNVKVGEIDDLSPEQLFTNVYRVYASGDIEAAYKEVEYVLDHYDNDYISRFELLKARILARKEGLQAYKEALNFVAMAYSSTTEGKEAENLLNTEIVKLNSKSFVLNSSGDSWKIAVFSDAANRENIGVVRRSMADFAAINSQIGIKFSEDYYLANEKILVLHGFRTRQDAEKVIERLGIKAYPIEADNYVVVQIKKNWEAYVSAFTN